MKDDTRSQALKWWHSMTFEEQFFATIKWLSSQDRNTAERHPSTLTGGEIEEVYLTKPINAK